jgi:hypothetical protein
MIKAGRQPIILGMAFGTIGRKSTLLVTRGNIILRLMATNTNLRGCGDISFVAHRTLNNQFVGSF